MYCNYKKGFIESSSGLLGEEVQKRKGISLTLFCTVQIIPGVLC